MSRKSNGARLILAGLAVGWLLLPAGAFADVDFGVRAGVYDDASEAFVGLELLTRIDGSQWFFNPNVEWVLVDNGNLITVNADFHYDFPTSGQFSVWAGGGPALVLIDPDRGDNETDAGLNLLAGLGFDPRAAVRPYIQGKILIADETEAVLGVGIRF